MVDKGCIAFSKLPKLALLQPAPLRKRLWQGGGVLLVILSTFTIGNFFLSPDKSVSSYMLGHDFLAFYSAGTFARTGQFNRLYDLDSARDTEHAIARQSNLEIGPSFGPYWNPPFYAWYLAPFTALPYRQALGIWTLLNVAFLSISIGLLIRLLPQPRTWQTSALVPLLVVVCMCCIQAMSHAQNTFMSLMLLTLVVTAWRKDMPLTAGLVCGLLFYKPQLAAIIAMMLVLTLGLRAALGVGIIGAILLLVTILTMPGTITNYLHQLPLNLKYMQVDHDYLWERHATLRAFWRLLFQGREAGAASFTVTALTVTSSALIAAGLFGAFWRVRRTGLSNIASDRLIGATIIAMPLLMPFYFDYDLLLLAVPAVLLAGEILQQPAGQRDRWQRAAIGSWIALYTWLMFNPSLAAASGVNVTVVILTALCGLSITRAMDCEVQATSLMLPTLNHLGPRREAA